jgi:cell division protease FtsH
MVAGLVAEKFIYGPENAGCGADSDLEKATSLAVELSDTLGYTEVTQKSRCEDRFPEAVLRTSKDESFVRRLMDKGEQTAREVIKKHKKFLLALADALLANSSIDQKTIETIMKKYKVCCAKTFDYVKAFNNSKK